MGEKEEAVVPRVKMEDDQYQYKSLLPSFGMGTDIDKAFRLCGLGPVAQWALRCQPLL